MDEIRKRRARPSAANIMNPLVLRAASFTIYLANLFSVQAHNRRNADDRARG
jgi:hypothetical protein